MAKMIICKKCGEEKKHFAKGLCCKCYFQAYYQQSERKEKRKAYFQRPERKENRKAYLQQPEVKEKIKAYYQRPERKENRKAYLQQPEVKEKIKGLTDTKCQSCGLANNLIKNYSLLNAHRMVPGVQGGKYTKENVIGLCPTCHAIIHKLILIDPKNPDYYTREGIIKSVQEVLQKKLRPKRSKNDKRITTKNTKTNLRKQV